MPASTMGCGELLATAPVLLSAPASCHGQKSSIDLVRAILGCRLADFNLMGSYVYLVRLMPINLSTLTVLAIMALSLLGAGFTTLKLIRGSMIHRATAMSGRQPGNILRAMQAASIACFVMCIFELSKMALYPDIHIWAFHSITILFAALLAALLSSFVLKREQWLRHEMASSEERYRLLFESSLCKKSYGKESRLSYLGHALVEPQRTDRRGDGDTRRSLCRARCRTVDAAEKQQGRARRITVGARQGV